MPKLHDCNPCGKVDFMAVPGQRDGAFREGAAHPAKMAFKLPEGVGALEGSLCEPLRAGLHAVQKSVAWLCQSAAVFGSGCIGLAILPVL